MKDLFLTNYSDLSFLDRIKDCFKKCNSFTLSVSFIKKAGLVLFQREIEEALERGAKGRIITSTYQNFTDIASLKDFLAWQNKYDNFRNKQEVSVYQYFGGVRNEYTAIISYNLKDIIVSIEDKDKKINYDSTPIYYIDEDKIIFPNEMSIVFPLKDGSQYKVYKYATYEGIDKTYTLTSNGKSGVFNNFFLFDGEGLYFFPDEVTIKINDKDYIKLSANSYAEVIGGYTLTYYDKESNESKVVEIEGKKITAVNNYLDLSLSDRYFTLYDKKLLLKPSYNLDALLTD